MPSSEQEAQELAATGVGRLFRFWVYASASALLGDSFGAKTDVGRVAILFHLLAGNVAFAMVFSEIIMAMEAATISQDLYARKMQAINEMMVQHGVPQLHQRRVHRFYEFMWMVHGSAMNENDLDNPMEWLLELPAGLRVDINHARYKDFLRSSVLFQRMPGALLVVITQQLHPELFMPDEVVIKEGTRGDTMYFIVRGQVRVVKGRGKATESQLGTIGKGGFVKWKDSNSRGAPSLCKSLCACSCGVCFCCGFALHPRSCIDPVCCCSLCV